MFNSNNSFCKGEGKCPSRSTYGYTNMTVIILYTNDIPDLNLFARKSLVCPEAQNHSLGWYWLLVFHLHAHIYKSFNYLYDTEDSPYITTKPWWCHFFSPKYLNTSPYNEKFTPFYGIV